MKWDYCSAVVWGLDENDIDNVYRFDKAVVNLARRLNGNIIKGEPLNGYRFGVGIARDDSLLCQCLTSGTGSAAGSSQFLAASTADEVYPLIQELHPQHSASRLDACQDYCGEGVWDDLEGILTQIANQHRVVMAPFGEGHVRPDGTRDATKGRSWYFGSKASAFRVVLYEKGLERIAKGIPDDPTRVRLEVRVRPPSKSKAILGRMNLQPMDILGFSAWGKALADIMGTQDIKRVVIGSVWKPNEMEQLALKIVRMFDNGIERLIDLVGPEEFGRIIFDAHQKNRQAKEALKAYGMTEEVF